MTTTHQTPNNVLSNNKRELDSSSSDSESTNAKRQKTTSFPKDKICILLLEGIHKSAIDLFEAEGFQVESHARALSEEELLEKIPHFHAVGIRSKTKLSAKVFASAKKLLCTGSFCIGTDTVDLEAAMEMGVPSFNAPFGNTRSVAEMVVSHVIALARRSYDVNKGMHEGNWSKTATNCFEVRGKTIGIVGYGHVGSQVSVLAEALGMKVLFYDVVPKMGIGNAQGTSSLDDLLASSDFVTLHVPGTPETVGLIKNREIRKMRPGSYVINYSRGTVVDPQALADALRDGHLGGAAVDVFPVEPQANGPGFVTPLQGCPNTILTPHIGGSTVEAQALIGVEVAQKIIDFINTGSSDGAVNFPWVKMLKRPDTHHCVINVHRNHPGVLASINSLLAGINISRQLIDTNEKIGYMLIAVDQEVSHDVVKQIKKLPASIKTRRHGELALC
jgi:D-3-phosphoglycerate dehydrogenase